jgi:hypothetical protein
MPVITTEGTVPRLLFNPRVVAKRRSIGRQHRLRHCRSTLRRDLHLLSLNDGARCGTIAESAGESTNETHHYSARSA